MICSFSKTWARTGRFTLLAFLLLFLHNCSSCRSRNVGSLCEGPQDCGASQVCFKETCSSFACEEDNDCPYSFFCEDELCKYQECGAEEECPYGFVCADGYCHLPCQLDESCTCLEADDCTAGPECNYASNCYFGECLELSSICGGQTNCCLDGDVCTCCDLDCACVYGTDCDDEKFCTGEETCIEQSCQSTGDPCFGRTPYCNEIYDRCDATLGTCQADGDCSDGRFCSGIEFCQDGLCVSSGDPCGSEFYCNESLGACECTGDCACTSDGDCDDGNFCTGFEICADGQCLSSGTPCGGATPY